MKILVPGATGAVGKNVVEQALARGHEVVVIARNPVALPIDHPKLTKAKVDILDAAAVVPLLEDVDAVVSTVGIGASKDAYGALLGGDQERH